MGGSTVVAMTKTWLITGAGRGMGVEFARAALAAGHNVVATGRDPDAVRTAVGEHEHLLVTALDVTDPHSAEDAAAAAVERFGRIDVLVNNAGSFLAGFFEELTTEQVRAQIETNLFGPLWVTQAALPILRAQRSGHIIQVSSIGGVLAFPMLGLYHASKWGLEAFTQSLAAEVAEYGIKVTIIEPGGYATDWSGPSAVQAEHLPEYEHVREMRRQLTQQRAGTAGDPDATASAILELVDADEPPLRQLFGAGVFENMIRPEYERRLESWERTNALAEAAHGGVAR